MADTDIKPPRFPQVNGLRIFVLCDRCERDHHQRIRTDPDTTCGRMACDCWCTGMSAPVARLPRTGWRSRTCTIHRGQGISDGHVEPSTAVADLRRKVD